MKTLKFTLLGAVIGFTLVASQAHQLPRTAPNFECPECGPIPPLCKPTDPNCPPQP